MREVLRTAWKQNDYVRTDVKEGKMRTKKMLLELSLVTVFKKYK